MKTKVTEGCDIGGGPYVQIELPNGRVVVVWDESVVHGNPIIDVWPDMTTLENSDRPMLHIDVP